MKRVHLLFFAALMVLSCSKNETIIRMGIIDFSQTVEPHTAETARSRLALAKIVSLAFVDDEFTAYFKQNFGSASSRGFFYEELLLVKHIDDIVKSDGTTLKDFLNSIQDREVNEIFGNNFIDQVLAFDNRVTIKLPDFFLGYDWDIKDMRPVVYACYQARSFEDSFIGYLNGHAVDVKMALSLPDVFHVNIKASDDYILLRSTDLRDAFDDDLINYLPQLRECQHIYEGIIQESIRYDSWFVVDLRKAFQKWQETCGFKGQYIDTGNCQETCQRQCSTPPVRHYVLDHFTMDDFTWFLAVNTVHYQESFSFLAQYRTTPAGENLPAASVPVVRISELGLMYEVKDLGGRKKQRLPYLNIEFVRKPEEINSIPIKHHFADGDDLVLLTNATYILNGDRFFIYRVLDSPFHGQFNSAFALSIGTNIYEYCDKATENGRSGGFRWVFRY